MTIRPLVSGDAKAASALHALSFDTPWNEADMARYIAGDLCYGAFRGGALCAFIVMRVAGDQADIVTIAVHPNDRKHGHGTAVLSAAEAAASARGVTTIFLEVAIDNAPAIALYKARGYHGVGKRPAYYKRPGGRVAALILRKDLG